MTRSTWTPSPTHSATRCTEESGTDQPSVVEQDECIEPHGDAHANNAMNIIRFKVVHLLFPAPALLRSHPRKKKLSAPSVATRELALSSHTPYCNILLLNSKGNSLGVHTGLILSARVIGSLRGILLTYWPVCKQNSVSEPHTIHHSVGYVITTCSAAR